MERQLIPDLPEKRKNRGLPIMGRQRGKKIISFSEKRTQEVKGSVEEGGKPLVGTCEDRNPVPRKEKDRGKEEL